MKVLRDTNPYNGEVLVEIQQASRGDMEAAYKTVQRGHILAGPPCSDRWVFVQHQPRQYVFNADVWTGSGEDG
jgi:hypothetical protein